MIGRRRGVAPERAADRFFGITVAIDVTALDLMIRDASFAWWTGAKGCDSFGIFVPAVATKIDPQALVVAHTSKGASGKTIPSVTRSSCCMKSWPALRKT